MRKDKQTLCVLGLAATLMLGALATAQAAEQVVIDVAPHTLLLSSSQGGEVTVHAAIPLARVDGSSITLNDIPVKWTKADARGELVAKFDEESVKAIVTAPRCTLTLRGVTVEGETFEGSDVVRVVP